MERRRQEVAMCSEDGRHVLKGSVPEAWRWQNRGGGEAAAATPVTVNLGFYRNFAIFTVTNHYLNKY
jgi:hypothetical protein